MSAEQEISEATNETADNTAPAETQDTGGDQDNSKPAGYDPVDVSQLPEAVQERINYLYSQVKNNERWKHEYKSIAAEQAAKIEDLMNGVGQVVDHLQAKDLGATEAEINKSMRSAFESGDMDKFLSDQQKLIDLGVKKQLNQNKPKPQQKQAQPVDEDSRLSKNDERVVDAWQNETDDAGKQLRPWAFNPGGNEDPDPEYVKALLIGDKYARSNPNASINDVLKHIDTKMGIIKTRPGQAVMGGSLQTPGKKSTVKLTPQQERIAIRGKIAGPKASDADHLKSYREQLEKFKGARK